MRLGGWIRLWIVLGLCWGVAVAFVGYDGRPRHDRVISAWSDAGTNAIADRISEHEDRTIHGFQIRGSLIDEYPTDPQLVEWFESVERKPKLSQVIYLDDLKAVNARFRKRIANLPAEQRTYAFNAFLVWIVPLLCILALAYALAWIWRGFRPRATA